MKNLRTWMLSGILLASGLMLTACGGGGEEPVSPSPAASSLMNASAQATPVEDAGPSLDAASQQVVDKYADVLDAPEEYVFAYDQISADEKPSTYEYALVELNGGGTPELLVAATVQDGDSRVIRVFGVDEAGELVDPDGTFLDGVAGAGGKRAEVLAEQNGRGIAQIFGRADEPNHDGFVWTLDGAELKNAKRDFTYDATAENSQWLPIEYFPVDDRDALHGFEPTMAEGTQEVAESGEGSTEEEPVVAENLPMNTARGTIRVLNAPELARLQGMDMTPNGEDESYLYAVFIFDEPQSFKANSSGDPGQQVRDGVRMVGLGERAPWGNSGTGFDQDGVSMIAQFPDDQCWFPSDAALPMGEPYCETFSPR